MVQVTQEHGCPSHNMVKITESQDGGVGRDLCGSRGPTPLPKQGHLQQAA